MKSGKSTLLSCIVGGDEVDKGDIWVLGGKPKTKSSKTLTRFVGYMPQVLGILNCIIHNNIKSLIKYLKEFSLYKTMTILELLSYFGQLYNIHYKFILWRMNYYSELFTLPTNAIIKNLKCVLKFYIDKSKL